MGDRYHMRPPARGQTSTPPHKAESKRHHREQQNDFPTWRGIDRRGSTLTEAAPPGVNSPNNGDRPQRIAVCRQGSPTHTGIDPAADAPQSPNPAGRGSPSEPTGIVERVIRRRALQPILFNRNARPDGAEPSDPAPGGRITEDAHSRSRDSRRRLKIPDVLSPVQWPESAGPPRRECPSWHGDSPCVIRRILNAQSGGR